MSLFEQLAEHAALPFERGRMLPLEAYGSEELLQAETRELFGSDWLCVARTADVPERGNYVTAQIPGPTGPRSLIVLRSSESVHVFDNVCVHRGAELLHGCGTESRITCPYHAWAYRLDGSLVAAPYMSESTELDGTPFDPANHSLSELRSEVWEGFVFVTQNTGAEALSPQLSGLSEVVSRYRMSDYASVFESVDIWSTNWKLLVENFMDAYHIFKVHNASFGAAGDNTRFTRMHPGTSHWAHHRVLNPADPDMCAKANTSLDGDWRKTIVLAAVFPGFVIQLQPDWMWFLRITPLGTDRVRIAWQVAIAPETLTAQSDPDAYVDEVMTLIHQVNGEDRPIVEGIRRNVDRPQFTRGPLSYLERNAFDFDRYIAERLHCC